MVSWGGYLKSICDTYISWWQVYTLTDVVEEKTAERQQSQLWFEFDLKVQTVQSEREEPNSEKQKIERLGVLEELRKYSAESNLGLVFRQVTQSYDAKFKQAALVTAECRRWWQELKSR